MKLLRPLITLLICLAALPASAGLLGQGASKFLPVDQAFKASAMATGNNSIAVTWQIADHYYLYRHAFKFETPESGGPALGKPELPQGTRHTDPFFGEVETYRHSVTAIVPLTNGVRSGGIQVQYQGCADAGLCYPPQTRTLQVDWSAVGVAGPDTTDKATPASTSSATGSDSDTSTRSATGSSSDASKFVSQQSHLADALGQGNMLWVLLTFFGLGILLAFTPCVLPMIPILSSIVVGSGERASPLRGFALSLVYVLAMALAYTVFGVLAGLTGTSLQAALQAPWVLVPFALVFVALSLSMFGLYQLQIPSSWQTRLGQIGNGRAGGLIGAGVMGFVAALIVGPCLAPPLAGALLFIGSTGNAVLGGAALFVLGLGMGVPLLVLGTVGGGAIPAAGPWMEGIKQFFGVILLGVAIWLLTRLLPAPLILVLWACLLIGYGVHLGALESRQGSGQNLLRAIGVLALIYAAILLVGAAMGAYNPLRPLQPLTNGSTTNATLASASNTTSSPFHRVQGLAALQAALQKAAQHDQPAVVDFYADWCIDCVQMEHTVFNQPQVQQALAPLAAIQLDMTAYDAADRKILRHYDVLGPPTIMFFAANGKEKRAYRLVGATDVQGFITRLNKAISQ